jgi:hypothetical protein
MFIRDDEDMNDGPSRTDKLFSMAEYCQVFLTAHYIKNGEDDGFIPLIERNKLDRMPKAVAEEMDLIFQMAIKQLEKWGADPAEFFRKMEIGEIDPVSDFIDTSEMRNALGNVVMRRLRIEEGIRDEEAFDEAKKILPEMRDNLHTFVSEIMLNAIKNVAKDLMKNEIPFDKASEIFNPRVKAIAHEGIITDANPNRAKMDKLRKEQKASSEKKVRYDPAWG